MRAAAVRSYGKIKYTFARICTSQTKNYSSKSEVLHESILPTYHFQNCLPRLPIPKLEDTLERYIRSLRALQGHPDVNESSIQNTERGIEFFKRLEGPSLHKALVQSNEKNSHTSYISEPWFDMYLSSRSPLPLNFNPFISFKPDSNKAMNDQAIRSTNFIIAAMKFQKTLKKQILSPEVYYLKDTAKSTFYQQTVKYLPNAFMLRYLPMAMNGAYPLDMSQFVNLFNSTRIPHKGKDKLETYQNSRHILVIRNGHFYTVDTLDIDGSIMNPYLVKCCIDHILDDQRPPAENSIGYLTTTDRDTWKNVRDHLISSGNEASLHAIDSAIFCLVLEDSKTNGDLEKTVNTFLHGNGSSRWFDKSFSLIMGRDGDTGLNFEHAWGDGVAVMRFFNEIFDESTTNPAVSPDNSSSYDVTKCLRRLEFHLDNIAKQSINDAKMNYEDITGKLRISAGQYDKMHKGYLKEKKVSPDGILQLAIQVGHYRLFGHPAATYESCSTSAFKHGRTETIRSCTLEAQAAAKAITEGRSCGANNKLKTDAEYRKKVEGLIRESCARHGELTKQAAMGQGFDRHLFGLRNIAEKQMGITTPSIFLDPSYATMNHIILSTSTLASHAVAMGGFAPVVPDGFGVGYGVRDEYIGCNITSYHTRDVAALVDAIVASFEDIHTVLEG